LGVRVRLGYDTWGVKPGDKLYLKPEDRAHIW
jgi:predicted metalloendopeptidase